MPDLFDPDPTFDLQPTPDLIALVNDTTKPASHRFAAATTLGRRCRQHPELVEVLHQLATSPQMRETRMMRLVSISYIAVAGLVYCGTPEAIAAAQDAYAGFTKADQDSLDFFLKSGELVLPAP